MDRVWSKETRLGGSGIIEFRTGNHGRVCWSLITESRMWNLWLVGRVSQYLSLKQGVYCKQRVIHFHPRINKLICTGYNVAITFSCINLSSIIIFKVNEKWNGNLIGQKCLSKLSVKKVIYCVCRVLPVMLLIDIYVVDLRRIFRSISLMGHFYPS